MKHSFIVLEGIDNVGKTSVANNLVHQLRTRGAPAQYYKTPHQRFATSTRWINHNASTDAHFLYHAAMIKVAEQEISTILKTHTIVCDRWFYSTFAYHKAAGSNLPLTPESFMELKPAFVFLLVANEEERTRRGQQKGSVAEPGDLLTKEQSPIIKEADTLLRSMISLVIDTSCRDIPTTSNFLHDHILGQV